MFYIDKNSSRPYYEQIILSVKEAILQKIILPGEKLPSVRELAATLMMNPNTISKAYKILESQDVIVTVKGKGTFVKNFEETRDDKQIERIKEEIEHLVIEATYLQVSVEEMQSWITQAVQQLGGMKNADSEFNQKNKQ